MYSNGIRIKMKEMNLATFLSAVERLRDSMLNSTEEKVNKYLLFFLKLWLHWLQIVPFQFSSTGSMQTNMIIRQTLRLGSTAQRMNPKRNATVFKRVYPPKRLPGKIFSFSDNFMIIYIHILTIFAMKK